MTKRYILAAVLIAALLAPAALQAGFGGEVGDTPPDFTLQGIDDKEYILYDYFDSSATVLVYFWCYKPCGKPQGKLDSLQTMLYDVYHDLDSLGLQILAVNCGDGKDVARFWADNYSITFPMLYVEGQEMTDLLNDYEISDPSKPMTDELIAPWHIDTTADTNYTEPVPLIHYRARPPQATNVTPLISPVEYLVEKNQPKQEPGVEEESADPAPLDIFLEYRTDLLDVRFSLPNPAHTTLSLFDASGRMIYHWGLGNLPAGEHSINRSVTDLSQGLYFLRIKAGTFSATRKVIIAR